MDKELEHRIYSTLPPMQEHDTSSEYCWCKPTIKRDGDADLVIHNDIAEFFEGDERGH